MWGVVLKGGLETGSVQWQGVLPFFAHLSSPSPLLPFSSLSVSLPPTFPLSMLEVAAPTPFALKRIGAALAPLLRAGSAVLLRGYIHSFLPSVLLRIARPSGSPSRLCLPRLQRARSWQDDLGAGLAQDALRGRAPGRPIAFFPPRSLLHGG